MRLQQALISATDESPDIQEQDLEQDRVWHNLHLRIHFLANPLSAQSSISTSRKCCTHIAEFPNMNVVAVIVMSFFIRTVMISCQVQC